MRRSGARALRRLSSGVSAGRSRGGAAHTAGGPEVGGRARRAVSAAAAHVTRAVLRGGRAPEVQGSEAPRVQVGPRRPLRSWSLILADSFQPSPRLGAETGLSRSPAVLAESARPGWPSRPSRPCRPSRESRTPAESPSRRVSEARVAHSSRVAASPGTEPQLGATRLTLGSTVAAASRSCARHQAWQPQPSRRRRRRPSSCPSSAPVACRRLPA